MLHHQKSLSSIVALSNLALPRRHARVPQPALLRLGERFDLKLFLSLDLIRELVALQHSQTTGEVERMGDFAPDYR